MSLLSVIATASGDGLIHEVINGLAVRSDARKALKIPITPIPTGSANGMCINLMGVEETFNVPLACLNVIKGAQAGGSIDRRKKRTSEDADDTGLLCAGKSLPFDLCSITQGDERRFSFMSLAAGLMCDVDIGEWPFTDVSVAQEKLTYCSFDQARSTFDGWETLDLRTASFVVVSMRTQDLASAN